MTCSHMRLMKSGRNPHFLDKPLTLTCLDCGQFWTWDTKSRIWKGTGIVGGLGHQMVLKKKAQLEL